MATIDIFFLGCLIVGAMYPALTLVAGGFSHVAGGVNHLAHSAHIDLGIQGGHVGGHAGHGHSVDGSHHSHGSQNGTGHGAEDSNGSAKPTAHHPDLHLHHDSPGFSIMQYLNPMSIAGFLLGFGTGGYVSGMFGSSMSSYLRVGIGALSGWSLWYVAYLIIVRMFGSTGASSHIKVESLVGHKANVSVKIDGSHAGMIVCEIAGSRKTIRAITEDDESIPVGASVRIRKLSDQTAIVQRLDFV